MLARGSFTERIAASKRRAQEVKKTIAEPPTTPSTKSVRELCELKLKDVLSEEISASFTTKRIAKISKLAQIVKVLTSAKLTSIGVFGVICHKEESGKKLCVRISDLHAQQNVVSVILTGACVRKVSTWECGTVIAVIDAELSFKDGRRFFTLVLDNPENVMKIGAAAEYGCCAGKGCKEVVNITLDKLCQKHWTERFSFALNARRNLSSGMLRLGDTMESAAINKKPIDLSEGVLWKFDPFSTAKRKKGDEDTAASSCEVELPEPVQRMNSRGSISVMIVHKPDEVHPPPRPDYRLETLGRNSVKAADRPQRVLRMYDENNRPIDPSLLAPDSELEKVEEGAEPIQIQMPTAKRRAKPARAVPRLGQTTVPSTEGKTAWSAGYGSAARTTYRPAIVPLPFMMPFDPVDLEENPTTTTTVSGSILEEKQPGQFGVLDMGRLVQEQKQSAPITTGKMEEVDAVQCFICGYLEEKLRASCEAEEHEWMPLRPLKRYFKCKLCEEPVFTLNAVFPPQNCASCGGFNYELLGV